MLLILKLANMHNARDLKAGLMRPEKQKWLLDGGLFEKGGLTQLGVLRKCSTASCQADQGST